MTDGLSIFCAALSAFICLALPTILALVLILKYKASWKAFVLGIAVFTVFQLFTRIPILQALQNNPSYILFAQTGGLLYAILLALSAGVFEEMGRFVGMQFFMRKELSWKNGVAYGLGHGGVEAFVLVGIPYIQALGALIAGDPKYMGTPPYMFLVGGVERVFAVAIHIGMTMLVLYAVKQKKISYLLLAILFHTVVDTGAVLFAGGSVWFNEVFVAIFAALAVLIMIKFKKKIDQSDLALKWRF
jgi:Predicted membrane protein